MESGEYLSMEARGKERNWLMQSVKVIVFIFAIWYLSKYMLTFNLAQTMRNTDIKYLILAAAFSATSLLLQAWVLRRLSRGTLTFRDSFFVEFYTLVVNLGFVSSLFSLPKIAFINSKIRDLKESTRLFALPFIFGVTLRAAIIIAFGLLIYAGALAAATAALAFTLAIAAMGHIKRIDGLIEPLRLTTKDVVDVSLLSAINILCVGLSYYFVILALGGSPPPANVIFCEGIGYLTGFFSPVPMGLGVREVALTELNTIMQVQKETAFSAAIIYRFMTIGAQTLMALMIAASAKVVATRGCDKS